MIATETISKSRNTSAIKPEQIKLEIREEPELIEFDQIEPEPEDLEFGSDEEELEEVGNSRLSTETEKRGNELKEKIVRYLHENRNSIPNEILPRNNEQDDKDGKLIVELDHIHEQENMNREIQMFNLMFNKKPENAINDYIAKGYILHDTPEAIADYLIKIQGLNKGALGEYFGKNDKKVLAVLHAYCLLLNFKNMEFDLAIRQLLSKFRLPGQAQQIERIIWEFALAFYETNTDTYDNADELFPLAYAIIMLATDAHNPKQERKMTREQFVSNTQRPCPSISNKFLTNIYERITNQKFATEVDYFETIIDRIKDLSVSNIGQAIELSKVLMKGDIFLKICKNTNKFVQRKLSLSEDQQKILWVSDPPKEEEKPRFIYIKDIVDLTLGIGSEVMRKNKVPEEFDSLCFTITTLHRTLDLKAKTTKDKGKWINYLRAILIQRRQEQRKQMEEVYKSTINNQIIEQIWNNDIFPFWDRHWDYKNRKPMEKGVIARGIEAICSCWSDSKKNENLYEKTSNTGIPITTTLLEALWKHGLPPASRKTLWLLVIGNNLALTPLIIDDIKKRKKHIQEFKHAEMEKEVIEMIQILMTMRPDLPPVRDLLLMGQAFYKIFAKDSTLIAINGFANLIHSNHFLSFYRGERGEIDLRIQLFQFLMEKNVTSVKSHFKGLKIETRMFLVSWFLSVFASCFEDEFLMRIWDSFILEGELYLFKVGIALIKYYEIELKMCTFSEGLKMLKFPKSTSSVLFFHILENKIDVSPLYYEEYIEKRKHAIIKTKVQSIPLE